MSLVKNYDPGKIRMDLPTSNYIYELPLLSFSDIHGAVNLSLIFNYRMKEEQGNPFQIAPGYKLNLQKRLIMENNIPVALQGEDGNCTDIISTGGVYVLDNDDQRILRRNGTNYVLENMDYSKEVYDQFGKIVSTYDKYGRIVLAYEYDAGDCIWTITYRSSKTISLSIMGSLLEYIDYADCSTCFSYYSNRFIVEHYSGVKYTLSTTVNNLENFPQFPWLNFSAVATDRYNTSVAPHTIELLRSTSCAVVINQKVGNEIIDTTTYDFYSLMECNIDHPQVEVINKDGIKTRMQYQTGKLCCTYQMIGEDMPFDQNNQFLGRVQLYEAINEDGDSHMLGAIDVMDGDSMSCNANNLWSCPVYNNVVADENGFFLLTGWICNAINDDAGVTTLCVSDHSTGRELEFDAYFMPNQKWTFFAYKFRLPIDSNYFYVFLDNPGRAYLSDLRLSFYTPESKNLRYVYAEKDILIAHRYVEDIDDIEYTNISIADSTFSCNSWSIPEPGRVTFYDLLKYKLNQKKGINTTEFYCDRGKTVLVANSNQDVTVTASDGRTFSLNECYLGTQQITPDGINLTRIIDDVSSLFLVCQNVNENGYVFFSQTLDNNLDVLGTIDKGTSTIYNRDQGLIVQESVSGLYTRTTAYSTDSDGNPVITATDEFGKATKYTLDPTWGGVKQIVLPDGSTITDTYDEDMCTLMERTFGNANGRLIEYSSVDGKLNGMRSGYLEYLFNYDNRGRLISADKYYTRLEEHIYNANNTRVQSYYPSQSGSLHSVDSTFDAYGKLLSVAGVLTNTYDIWPEFDSGTGALNGHGNGCNALLAMSTDELRGETARFTYDEITGLLKKKEVSSKTNYASKVSTETFDYDDLNRLTTDDCTYRASDKVTSAIEYATRVDDPFADNRVKKYTYNINGSSAAVTATTYDTYKRPNKKTYQIGGQTFSRTFTYEKTRLSYVSDSAGGDASILYDDCGRVRR
ncbi:MAG: RHS repeat protein, partial [Oscillospiraceae bacterium]|nr:RHS repeat protein [Oscillospiraceae bacterium]